MNTKRWLQIRWTLATALTISTLIFSITFWLFHYTWQSRSDSIFEYLLPMDAVIEHDLNILRELNLNSSPQSCDPETLSRMRIAEFRSASLHEFGLVKENELVCTTVSGVLPVPFLQASADLMGINGIEFTQTAQVTSVPGNHKEMQVKIGAFRALIRPPIPPVQAPWLEVGIFALSDKGLSKAYGTSNIQPRYRPETKGLHYWTENGYWVAESCYNSVSCGVVSVDIAAYLWHERESSLVIFTCLLLICGLGGVVSTQLYERYITLSRQLKRGLSSQRIECLYQPILTFDSGKYESCEVLCRWRDENDQLLSPALFINEIEHNGQAQKLTRLVMDRAIAELTEAKLLGKIRFAINAFPEDIATGHIEQMIDELLPSELHQLVTIEVTEREVEDMGRVAQGIQRLRQKSVLVAIDDFGTGFSNFQHLEKLQIDYLKIDKSFVWSMESHGIRGSLVGAMVSMARTLKVRTIAEGVETNEQLAQLKRLGVDLSQGYLHAKPMPIKQLTHFIKQSSG